MLRFVFNLLLIVLIICIISVAIIAWYVVPGLPDIDTLKDVKMQVPLRVYSSQGALISEFGEKRRAPVAIDQVPDKLIKAFIAAEDDRFYSHPGVDWQAMIRAVYSLIKTRTKKQGASTITMQVARNFFLSREKTYARKLNEVFLALKIERELSKQEILELYLNKIYFGQRAYGISAAAQVYYSAGIDELTLAQAAMIAGLPTAPSKNNPVTDAKRALDRRNYVLRRMREQNFIDENEYQHAKVQPITASLYKPATDIEAPYVAEMVRADLLERFGEEVYTQGLIVRTTIIDNSQIAANLALRKALIDYDQRHGYRGAEQRFDIDVHTRTEADFSKLLDAFPMLGNLIPAVIIEVGTKSATAFIHGIGRVAINWNGLQWARPYITENRRGPAPRTAGEILQIGDIVRLRESVEGEWQLSQIPAVEGGLVSMNPDNGATLALVGGFDFLRSKFNRVTQAQRQPGSSFKPFIYSASLRAGKTAASIINDAPVVFADPGSGNEWRPKNYSRKSYGPTRFREALVKSRNLVSVRLLDEIGLPFALDHIARFGFDTSRLPANLSLALGSGELTPWELIRGYCVFANNGYLIDPHLIETISTYDGTQLFQATPKTVCRECTYQSVDESEHTLQTTPASDQALTSEVTEMNNEFVGPKQNIAPMVVDPRNIHIMNSIMRDVIRHGTGRKALSLNRNDLAGKTGTTNNQHDAWFAGFNRNIATIAWVGFDQFRPLGSRETGSRAALPMWIEYMKPVLAGMPESIIARPTGLTNIKIDSHSGQRASVSDPDAIFEIFRTENIPPEQIDQPGGDLYLDDFVNEIPEQLF